MIRRYIRHFTKLWSIICILVFLSGCGITPPKPTGYLHNYAELKTISEVATTENHCHTRVVIRLYELLPYDTQLEGNETVITLHSDQFSTAQLSQ